ncbi:MAG: hypothetical protein HW421_2436 [Ignavibacteria bacterium]|nr:hypothetical protein [Ignavibacteria bacterium]
MNGDIEFYLIENNTYFQLLNCGSFTFEILFKLSNFVFLVEVVCKLFVAERNQYKWLFEINLSKK